MSDENQQSQPPPGGAPGEPSLREGAFDISKRQDFGWLLAALGIVVILATAAIVYFSGGLGMGRLSKDAIARVGSRDVSVADFENWVKTLPSSARIQLVKPEGKQQILKYFLDRVALDEYSKKQGVYDTEVFKETFGEQRGKLAVRLLIQQQLEEARDRSLMKAFYVEHRDRYKKPFEDATQSYQIAQDYQQDVISKMADAALANSEVQKAETVSSDGVMAQIVFGPEDHALVTVDDFEQEAAQMRPEERSGAFTPAGRKEILQRMLRIKALEHLARSRKIDESPQVQQWLEEMRPSVTAYVLAQQAIGEIGPKIREELDKNRAAYETTAMQAAHILVSVPFQGTPEQEAQALQRAKEIYAELSKPGADFAAVAKRRSEDPGSAPQGGVLGEIRPNQVVKPFAEAAFALQEGQITEPVRSMFGFHIIKALSSPKASFIEEEARVAARRKILDAAMEGQVEEIRKKVGVAVNDELLAGWQPVVEAPPPDLSGMHQGGEAPPAPPSGNAPAGTP